MKLLTIVDDKQVEITKIEVEDSSVDEFIIQVEQGKVWNTLDENGLEVQTFKVLLVEDITQEYDLRVKISKLVSMGEPDDIVCKKCINLIRGYNRENKFSSQQIFTMITAFSNIDMCLKNGMAKESKMLITNVVADGVIIKEELKIMLLEILKEY